MCKRFLMAVVLVSVATAANAQGPPASEDRCDELMWASPGLYGLCVAFWAQQCEPDFSLVDPYEGCKPASRKILELYNKKKGPNDPDMPGTQRPCSCWSQEELDVLAWRFPGGTQYCVVDYTGGNLENLDWWSVSGQPGLTSAATYGDYGNPAGPACEYHYIDVNPAVNDYRFFPILSPEEFAACEDQLNQAGADRGFSCFSSP